MRIICRMATQVPGHGIVKKGQSIEWADGAAMPPQVSANFRRADGLPFPKESAAPAAAKPADAKEDAAALVKRTANIGRAKLAAMLDRERVAFDGKASATELAKTLLRSRGEKID